MKDNKTIQIISIVCSWIIFFAYALIGLIANIWHPTWLILFLIPIIEELCHCIKNKDLNRFPIVFIVVAVYLALGITLNMWHPLWVIFFIVPLYYTTVNVFSGKNSPNNNSDNDNDDDNNDADKKSDNNISKNWEYILKITKFSHFYLKH